MVDVSRRSQPLARHFLETYEDTLKQTAADPLNLRQACLDFMTHFLSDPQKLADMQMAFYQDWMRLWQESARKFMGEATTPLYAPEKGDRRFLAPAWEESALFDFIKQSYLLSSRAIKTAVAQVDGIDEETRLKLDFYARQFVDAIAPTNFLMTNPEVLQETMKTHGENLLRGFKNLLDDLERGGGELAISTTDYGAFQVGENLAVTPGRVIYQNELMQLIQYDPTTKSVFRRPLLIVPPWINKYYILDLRPDNSFVRWAVAQGHTVFVISWVNPDKALAQKRFEDYMRDGVLAAMTQVEAATGVSDCNLLGYCLGGTLTAITLAWLAAEGQVARVASATFLTTMIDFAQSGEMKLFVDDTQLALLDQEMAEKGVFPGSVLKKTFSLLRANDLIWSFVVNNYLMGREPFPFDLLYWNDDATNMPAAMHSFYLRKCYNENRLPVPGGVTMDGVPIDMTAVKTPCYFLSTKEDHIAPWKATYAGTQLFSAPSTFVLAASGHVAGVINPPAKNKYCFWSGESGSNPEDPDSWLADARQSEGSWWPHWAGWLAAYGGGKVSARTPAKGIESAPGRYVQMSLRPPDQP
ncbi:MAG: class I poly(R)-hydroxyalkanoic acid synthase [Alphaproteobacteria bacterium]|nr:class I poly(R)-hydroxyalkanoic acid synthase [Alphaproteobacteria bacterium]